MIQASDFRATLAEAGIRRGDVVHVHASLFPLGGIDGAPLEEMPARVCEVWRDAVGADGTLTVPASFDDYARFGTPYDCRRSPVDRAQGALSKHVAALPEAIRTFCPLSAVAGVGALAADICHQPTGSGFGSGSAWERLYELDAKMCFLGVRPSAAFTFGLLIQFRFGVPYLYNKIYSTPIFDDGVPVGFPATCAVRYLDPQFQIREDCRRFEQAMLDRGLVRRYPIGRANLYIIESTRAVFAAGTQCLRDDLFYFLAAPPTFVEGRIPMDGTTGKFVPDAIRLGRASAS